MALILPYFQRERGLLMRALKSVADQQTTLQWNVRAIIVDDESPVSPEEDLKEIVLPPWLTTEVVRRENGGPGKARNTGLDAVGEADFVAFLDTDDTWARDHLSKAIQALEAEDSDFYFSDSRTTESETVFQLTGFPWPDVPIRALQRGHHHVFAIDAADTVSVLSRSYVCHTSSVIFRNTYRLAEQRFDADLRLAGEDHLMWLDLASVSRSVCFSTTLGNERGHGVDVFRSIAYSDRLTWFKRHCTGVLKYKKILARFSLDAVASYQVKTEQTLHSFEAFRAIMRPSGWRILRDKEARTLLRCTFPYPWIQTLIHIQTWRTVRRADLTSEFAQ